MSFTPHVTISIHDDGHMERRPGQMPAAVATSLPPVRVTVRGGTGCRLAARLLRRLASQLEHEGEDSP